MQENMPEFNSIDVDASGHRHLLLYTDHQLELLGNAKTWYMDATFRVVNRPWVQLFTINSFIRSGTHMKQVPLMYCFMSSKRKADYYEVLRTVDHLLLDQIKLQSFVVYFEAALWRALRDRFPAYTIQGCVFYWTQAVYRKVQELGLQRAYNERRVVFSFIRQVLALPFLPPEHVEETFHHLDRKANNDQLDSLLEYVWCQWIRNPTFPVKNWSVFMLSVRTNNDLEGWHNRFNNRVNRSGKVPFYLLLVELYGEAKNIPLIARLLSEGKMERINRKRYSKLNGKLSKAWEDYNNRVISLMVSKISSASMCFSVWAYHQVNGRDCSQLSLCMFINLSDCETT
ncbi:uncharacterized protein [Magallana gigas]|uniref:uncharacterized protein n=1 Tax=Magallana gigas TaxID=29159 RepID=UPI00333FED9C